MVVFGILKLGTLGNKNFVTNIWRIGNYKFSTISELNLPGLSFTGGAFFSEIKRYKTIHNNVPGINTDFGQFLNIVYVIKGIDFDNSQKNNLAIDFVSKLLWTWYILHPETSSRGSNSRNDPGMWLVYSNKLGELSLGTRPYKEHALSYSSGWAIFFLS